METVLIEKRGSKAEEIDTFIERMKLKALKEYGHLSREELIKIALSPSPNPNFKRVTDEDLRRARREVERELFRESSE